MNKEPNKTLQSWVTQDQLDELKKRIEQLEQSIRDLEWQLHHSGLDLPDPYD